jgi:hypothetical protein
MRRPPVRFVDIAAQLAQLDAQREALVLHAFDAVECRYPSLAQFLLQNLQGKPQAARWMATVRRAFEGKNAYEVLAEGDVDRVWDHLGRMLGNDSKTVAVERQMVY